VLVGDFTGSGKVVVLFGERVGPFKGRGEDGDALGGEIEGEGVGGEASQNGVGLLKVALSYLAVQNSELLTGGW